MDGWMDKLTGWFGFWRDEFERWWLRREFSVRDGVVRFLVSGRWWVGLSGGSDGLREADGRGAVVLMEYFVGVEELARSGSLIECVGHCQIKQDADE